MRPDVLKIDREALKGCGAALEDNKVPLNNNASMSMGNRETSKGDGEVLKGE